MNTDRFAQNDPFAMEVFRNGLVAIADRMSLTIARTARSVVVKEALDFSTAIFSAQGEMIAQGTCLPAHFGSLPTAVQSVLATYEGRLEPGDLVLLNDPFQGSTHLPDLVLICPVFVGGQLAALVAALAHHIDVGGRIPGSSASDSTEIYQEGLRLPPMKLAVRGSLSDELLRLIRANVREPEKVVGDLMAQVTACRLGAEELQGAIEEGGLSSFQKMSKQLLDYAEQFTRQQIRTRLSDGVYAAVDFIDDDGLGMTDLKIAVTIRVRGGEVLVDFGGTSGPALSAINAVENFTRSVTWACFRSVLDSAIPTNSGFFRVVRVDVPEGTLVSAEAPSAVAARALTGFRVADVVFAALAQALPDGIPATGSAEPEIGVTIAGKDGAGKPFVFFESLFGSWGAFRDRDGTDGCSGVVVNYSNTPGEIVESDFPLEVLSYGFVPDSGGAGRYRGGLAIERRIRFLGSQGLLQLRSDRRSHPPGGRDGGGAGAPSYAAIIDGSGNERVVPSKTLVALNPGDVVRIVVPGAGGNGTPAERDRAAILDDLRNGKISASHASAAYGYRPGDAA